MKFTILVITLLSSLHCQAITIHSGVDETAPRTYQNEDNLKDYCYEIADIIADRMFKYCMKNKRNYKYSCAVKANLAHKDIYFTCLDNNKTRFTGNIW